MTPLHQCDFPIVFCWIWAGISKKKGVSFVLFFKILFIHKRHTERGRHRQREKQSPREPDAGLDPGTPESHPRLKAGAQLLSHLGCPKTKPFRWRTEG